MHTEIIISSLLWGALDCHLADVRGRCSQPAGREENVTFVARRRLINAVFTLFPVTRGRAGPAFSFFNLWRGARDAAQLFRPDVPRWKHAAEIINVS